MILIASGSEVASAVQAHEKLLAEGIRSRVVSMPSWDIFEQQTQEYRDSVLPPEGDARVAVEQASTLGGSGTSADRAASWHEDVWGFGPTQRATEEVRIRARSRSRGRKGTNRQKVNRAMSSAIVRLMRVVNSAKAA